MSLAITPTGITIDTLSELIERLSTEYRNIYGQDIAIDQDTADGQRIGVESKLILDVQTALLYLYTSLDVDQAKGEALNRAIKYAGIVRRQATNSTWDLTVTADRALTIPSGYTIKDESGQEWQTVSDYTLAIGANSVSFEAVNLGAVVGLIGSTFEQVTVYLGITGIAASVSAVVGIDEETDEELRKRRNISIENPSLCTIGSLTAKLLQVENVTDCKVYENYTDTYDAELTLDAHSVWCVVEGGDANDIAEVIAKQKTAGTGMKGSVISSYTETYTRLNGTPYAITYDMVFDRPIDQPIYLRMDAVRTTIEAVDQVLLKQQLTSFDFNIGVNVKAFEFYALAQGVNWYPRNIEISLDGVTWVEGELTCPAGHKFSLTGLNITINEIIP
jgi:uncharacterized phage protein gp47/JayE